MRLGKKLLWTVLCLAYPWLGIEFLIWSLSVNRIAEPVFYFLLFVWGVPAFVISGLLFVIQWVPFDNRKDDDETRS